MKEYYPRECMQEPFEPSNIVKTQAGDFTDVDVPKKHLWQAVRNLHCWFPRGCLLEAAKPNRKEFSKLMEENGE